MGNKLAAPISAHAPVYGDVRYQVAASEPRLARAVAAQVTLPPTPNLRR